jgi:hypothetical protein
VSGVAAADRAPVVHEADHPALIDEHADRRERLEAGPDSVGANRLPVEIGRDREGEPERPDRLADVIELPRSLGMMDADDDQAAVAVAVPQSGG